MRTVLQIILILTLLGCQKKDLIDGVWITKDYPNCPLVIKFSDGLLIENLTGKSITYVSQVDFQDSIMIIKVLSETFYSGNKTDTVKVQG